MVLDTDSGSRSSVITRAGAVTVEIAVIWDMVMATSLSVVVAILSCVVALSLAPASRTQTLARDWHQHPQRCNSSSGSISIKLGDSFKGSGNVDNFLGPGVGGIYGDILLSKIDWK